MSEKTNWVFLPVHKSRVIKELEKSTLIKVSDSSSTILPHAFRRKKESDTMIYYSLPVGFKINVRFSYNEDGEYKTTDETFDLEAFGVKRLSTELE